MTFRRLRALLPVLAACVCVGLVAGPAGASIDGTAFTVDGQKVSNQSFTAELDALANNKPLAVQLKANGVKSVRTGSDKYDGAIAASWLASEIQQVVADKEFARKKLTLTAADRAEAKSQIITQFSTAAAPEAGTAIVAAFPTKFRNTLIDRQARLVSLIENAGGGPPTDADLQAYYAAHKSDLESGCTSGKVVRHIETRTQAQADAIKKQLDAGADFESLAQSKSTDITSGALGGELGCLVEKQFVPAFQTAADALPLDTVSAPVKVGNAWHLIEVQSLGYANEKGQIRQAIQEENAAKYSATFVKDIAAAKVSIDKRWGKVVRTSTGLDVHPPGYKPPASTTTTIPPSATGGTATSAPAPASAG